LLSAIGVLAMSSFDVVAGRVPIGWSGGVHPVGISVLSSRPDLVTGGDALVRVTVPGSAGLDQVSVTLNGQDVTAAFLAGDVVSEVADRSSRGRGPRGQRRPPDGVRTCGSCIRARFRLVDEREVPHGEIRTLSELGIHVLPFRDPDNIQIELTAPIA